MIFITCSKIDDNIDEKNGIWQAVECNPPSWQIVVKEGNGHRQNDEISNQKYQHTQIPVKPTNILHKKIRLILIWLE
jgi:hypothetical protein